MFTGDRSGDWLYGALYKFGFSSQPHSVSRDDGVRLNDCYITASVRCAPPANKPLRLESENCRKYLLREFELLGNVRVVVALGRVAFDAVLGAMRFLGKDNWTARPRFAHAGEFDLGGSLTLIASYHPSQQNTFTGTLTRVMFDRVFRRARAILNRERH
jgi:uracil-DNA glycosylase family 4